MGDGSGKASDLQGKLPPEGVGLWVRTILLHGLAVDPLSPIEPRRPEGSSSPSLGMGNFNVLGT